MFALYNKPRSIISCLNIINSKLRFLDNVSRTITNASPQLEKPEIGSKNHSFTVSYVMNNLGLSPQGAISNSKRVKFESLDKPESVVALFRDHGFSDIQISNIISKRPQFLNWNPNGTLLPKLKFLCSIGASSDDVASNPYILEHSLDKRIVPFYNSCKRMFLSDKQILKILRQHCSYILGNARVSDNSNIKLLNEVGVGMRYIGLIIYRRPRLMNIHYDKFRTVVYELLEMKFDPSKGHFVRALSVRLDMSDLTWAHKIEVYKRWGWTEHEIISAFRQNPPCMALSEENIMSGMDFLVNEMGCQSMTIAKRPAVLTYSLKSRLIPRCSVIKVLQMKGLISEEDLSLLSLLMITEQSFVDRFIIKYEEQLPQLLNAYQSRLGILELGES
nr:PREDICTED: uncharacterized protein LOC108214697 [Daucus carota subsp. sativus]XP_017242335.1 PREDICTED: uncharacterized protein LOC108214697 [Daucus carota subsp. sativus]XP_017242336.1 PREDICTED: uncharacterized protein LOC108214697 [Daucus carota subsp. sativus]XP_017242337.1 PREDICTED: uncharacterized protein LOC108214697 [Daucus carota subsp. sativus]XP_017242338.1 PREDICTED: uncharacterized protein LOC108214697 [Daucus carota subsp. sativus]